MSHRTRIEPIEVVTLDVDSSDHPRQVIAFRVHCSCGFISPVPLLNQSAANDDAREHREMYTDSGVQEAQS